ncbi:MAG: carbohydrate kinase [Eubacteriales bacterium]|nr:carbohydrate kinase [Eubacteriales bacterium]
MKKYLLGLDNGGSEIKCGLYATDGSEICHKSTSVKMNIPLIGFTERNMDEVWEANCDLISKVVSESGVDAADIISAAVVGYGNGINFIDEEGKPVYPSIVSTDSRAVKYINQWKKDGTTAVIYENTEQQIYASQPPAIIAWFRDHRKDVLEKAVYALQMKDYIRFKLTGEVAAEITDISNTGIYNIRKKEYALPVFEAADILEYLRLFPEKIIYPADFSGVITAEAAKRSGLQEGTPVAGGLFDIDACCLSSGVLHDDTLCIVAGTWSINEYITDDINQGIGKMSATISFLKDKYLISDSSATGLSNFNWYLKNIYQNKYPDLTENDLYKKCDESIASLIPKGDGVLFIPYLYASATNPNSKGAFLNLSGHCDVESMMLAVYEGIVFSSAYHVTRLMKNRKPFKKIRLSGGMINSTVWCQMLADVFQLPVEIVCAKQQGTLGAAICAGVASGVWEDFKTAVLDIVSIKKTYYPNIERKEIYERKFQAYLQGVKLVDIFHGEV